MKPKIDKPVDKKVNPRGERVSNGRSHVEGASSNGDKDIEQLDKSKGVEPQKRTR